MEYRLLLPLASGASLIRGRSCVAETGDAVQLMVRRRPSAIATLRRTNAEE